MCICGMFTSRIVIEFDNSTGNSHPSRHHASTCGDPTESAKAGAQLVYNRRPERALWLRRLRSPGSNKKRLVYFTVFPKRRSPSIGVEIYNSTSHPRAIHIRHTLMKAKHIPPHESPHSHRLPQHIQIPPQPSPIQICRHAVPAAILARYG